MYPFDAKLFLSGLRMKNVLFVEHQVKRNGSGSTYYTGKFYAITEKQNLIDITPHIASVLYHSLVKLHNPKKNKGELCLCIKSPHWMIREISQELYGDWRKINISILEFDNIF